MKEKSLDALAVLLVLTEGEKESTTATVLVEECFHI